jgi:hypothetical protein
VFRVNIQIFFFPQMMQAGKRPRIDGASIRGPIPNGPLHSRPLVTILSISYYDSCSVVERILKIVQLKYEKCNAELTELWLWRELFVVLL